MGSEGMDGAGMESGEWIEFGWDCGVDGVRIGFGWWMEPGWDWGGKWSRDGLRGIDGAVMGSGEWMSWNGIRVVDGAKMGSGWWMEPGCDQGNAYLPTILDSPGPSWNLIHVPEFQGSVPERPVACARRLGSRTPQATLCMAATSPHLSPAASDTQCALQSRVH